MSFNLRALLEEMIEKEASDLHISSGERPKLRVDGDIVVFACRIDGIEQAPAPLLDLGREIGKRGKIGTGLCRPRA